jgi:outer membrane protein assembly factor BamB
LIVDGLCIAQLGDEQNGAILAFDLSSGEQQWKWDGDGPSYGSPTLASIDGMKALITPTAENMVAIAVADGKLQWQARYSQGRYNAASPIVFGDTIIYAGPTRGTSAEKVVTSAEGVTTEPLWKNDDNSLIYNTPVLKDGLLFGVSSLNSLFCIKLSDGQTAWNAPLEASEPGGEEGQPRRDAQGARGDRPTNQVGEPQAGQGERSRGRGGRRGGGGRGRGGYGSTVDAGAVVLALTPTSELAVFEPTDEAFRQVAKYKVAESPTHAYPIVDGKRIFIKDQDSLILWTTE